ncbi:hypothetical protein FM125_03895 [Micrococcus lylae]|uniref:Uncharacterized protein n=1 Tax=Micrococcus lylae TaxID=1273 RepID=A0A1R4IQ53_9MICC|nr:hypothetical protein [Micrococcus lylae]SJN21992.1 hypothetical protein FM125_03895 [Micrococcus lylae]
MEIVIWIALLALVGFLGIGAVLHWREHRFYGGLQFQEKPALDVSVHMGQEGQTHFRQALRELRHALKNDRHEDAAGWVRAARRRGWWLAETAAASEESKVLGTVVRQVASRRARVEEAAVNIEETGAIGSLNAAKGQGGHLDAAHLSGRHAWSEVTDLRRRRIHDRTEEHYRWAVAEIVRIVELHCHDTPTAERLIADAQAPVTEEDLASWVDFEHHLSHWADNKVPHGDRLHPERPPLPAYATDAARKKHLEAARQRELDPGAHGDSPLPSTTTAPHLPTAPSAGRGATVVGNPAGDGWDGHRTLARRREQARGLHQEMTMKVASYDMDFDLQLKYPQFHNRDIPEVRAMDGAARRAADEWDLIESVPDRQLTADDVASYRQAVDAFKQAVLACDARVRLIGDSGISDAELRDLETARGLFRHISDPANPEQLREQYRARLVEVLRRIDSRPGSRVSFTPQGLLALEAGEGAEGSKTP